MTHESETVLAARLDAARKIIRAAESDMGGAAALAHNGGHLELLLDNTTWTRDEARDILTRLGCNLIPITVTVTLALDADAWQGNYGLPDDSRNAIAEDMRQLMRDAVSEFVADWIDRTGNRGASRVQAVRVAG